MNVYVSGILQDLMADIYIEYRLDRVLEYKLDVPETLITYQVSHKNESKTLITCLYKYIYTL